MQAELHFFLLYKFHKEHCGGIGINLHRSSLSSDNFYALSVISERFHFKSVRTTVLTDCKALYIQILISFGRFDYNLVKSLGRTNRKCSLSRKIRSIYSLYTISGSSTKLWIRIIRVRSNRLRRTRLRRHRIGITSMVVYISFFFCPFFLYRNLRSSTLLGAICFDFADFNFDFQDIVTFRLSAKTINIIRNIFTDSSSIDSILGDNFMVARHK